MIPKILNTLESGKVIRYHAAPSVLPQSVAHHSWNVAVIVLFLTDGDASAELLAEALLHDSAELFTGDIPFTVKRDNKDLKERFDALEDTARHLHLVLPPVELTPREQAILKMADTLDGFIWCSLYERGSLIWDRWSDAFLVGQNKFAELIGEDTLARAALLYHHFNRPSK